MNKKETAEFLGISTRLVEKYASEGRLGEIKYIREKTGKQADYDREAVEKLKSALESPDTAIAAKSPDARLFMTQLIDALAGWQALPSTNPEQPRAEAIRASEKLLLNLKECRVLTGLSEATLRSAIKAGNLKAKIIGQGWKVKRADLDDFVHNL